MKILNPCNQGPIEISLELRGHKAAVQKRIMRFWDLSHHIDPDKEILFALIFLIFSYPLILTCVLGAQKNHLIEMVPLSTHNICFR